MRLLRKLLKIENIDNIKILKEFKRHPPKQEKIDLRRTFYKLFGKYAVPVILDNENYLIDGYTTYLIAKENNKKYIKVIRI